ncbi:SpdA protein [Streptomyces fumigatiscleroticus]|nr:SpdA protein [Streptomyces fumigatiscleroticus]
MARPALRPDAVLVQAVIAGALSFAHLHDLAEAAGQTGWKAWAYPISVDLLLVAAWHRLRTDGPSRLAWCWFLVALVASLGANIATAGLLDLNAVPAWLRILVAAWPALAFMGGTLLAHSATPKRSEDRLPAPATPPEDAAPGIKREPAPASESAPAPEVDDTPALPAADPVPAPTDPAPAPAVPVPAALITHARKVADDHRARTGFPIDTDTLRARLGVPAPLADAIAAQLA